MSKCLFYTCRNVTGTFSVLLVKCLRILEVDNDQIDFLTSAKGKTGYNHIETISGLTLNEQKNFYAEYYENTAKHMDSWKSVYDAIDVSSLKEYDRLYIMGGLLFPSSGIHRYSPKALKFISTNTSINWVSSGIHIIHVIAMHKAHVLYGIPLHEFSLDTDELSSNMFDVNQTPNNYYTYHIYDMPSAGKTRLDALNYYLLNKPQKPFSFEEEDEYDFTMGYTVFPNGNRAKFAADIEWVAAKFDKVKLFTKDKVNNIDTSIPVDQYLDIISHSRFTYILPSYDNKCFSLYRFIESIELNCLPLIHPECYLDDVHLSFNADLTPLVTNEPMSEARRKELLTHYKKKFLVFETGFSK
jgi:hypothetical protein